MAVSYMVALERHIEPSDTGYITLAEGDIVFLAGTSDDPEYEYVQLVHSDRVGWVRLSLLQSVLLSPTRLPRFHITFALFGDNLVCQLITCFDLRAQTYLGAVYRLLVGSRIGGHIFRLTE